MLVSVGVGHEYFAIGGAAAINWVLKDGIGMMGKITFASKYSHLFDVNPMKWRLIGDLMHNLGAGLELCTIVWPNKFLAIAAIANIAKGVAHMANGATSAAFNKSFAIAGNLADVTAKGQSQAEMRRMIGISLGIGLSIVLGSNYALIFGSYATLASLHMFFNYTSVKSIHLNTLNTSQLWILISEYVRNNSSDGTKASLSNPMELNKLYSMLSLRSSTTSTSKHVQLGVKLSHLESLSKLETILRNARKDQKYLLWYDEKNMKKPLHILLHQNANVEDIILACLHAEYTMQSLQYSGNIYI